MRIWQGLKRRPGEGAVMLLMWGSAGIAVLITAAIIFSLLREAVHFFQFVSLFDFLFGTHWSPKSVAHTVDGIAVGVFGALPLLAGTLMITVIALLVAVPVGLYSAIYLAEYASPRMRRIAKPMLELLAGIPTVVYGYFAVMAVAPWMQALGAHIGLSIAAESALVAGLVMGIMIVPFVSSLSDDMITAVPRGLRDASYGLGATQSETIRRVVLRAALPGIMGAVLLAISRAIGETMIVVMAAGLSANLTANPLEAVTTVTVQMVTILTGDQSFDGPGTLAAFALGLTLFFFTLLLNIIAQIIVKKYREQYE